MATLTRACFRRLSVGPHFSEGARLLSAELIRRGMSFSAAAREIGTLPSTVTRWLNGDRRPVSPSLVKIRDLYGVPIEAWHERPKGRFETRAHRAAKSAARASAAA